MNESDLKKSLEIFAHKIKNPLHAAVINLDVLKVRLEKQGTEKATLKHLDLVLSEIQKISEMVKKYLGYWELSEAARKKKDLKKILG
jgi:nitrogen fixation/metabolism regulation signal transduction histidine kinase